MMQRVCREEHSPLQPGQSVLGLACGHLWSWNASKGEPPAEIDCIHCDNPDLNRRTFEWYVPQNTWRNRLANILRKLARHVAGG